MRGCVGKRLLGLLQGPLGTEGQRTLRPRGEGTDGSVRSLQGTGRRLCSGRQGLRKLLHLGLLLGLGLHSRLACQSVLRLLHFTDRTRKISLSKFLRSLGRGGLGLGRGLRGGGSARLLCCFLQGVGNPLLTRLQFLHGTCRGIKLRQGLGDLALRFLDGSEGFVERCLVFPGGLTKLFLQLGNLLIELFAGGLQIGERFALLWLRGERIGLLQVALRGLHRLGRFAEILRRFRGGTLRFLLQLTGLLTEGLLPFGQLVGGRLAGFGHFINGVLLHALLLRDHLIEFLAQLLEGFEILPGLFQFRDLLLQLFLRLSERIESSLLGERGILTLREGLLGSLHLLGGLPERLCRFRGGRLRFALHRFSLLLEGFLRRGLLLLQLPGGSLLLRLGAFGLDLLLFLLEPLHFL